jgi:hypothetical protein
MTFYGPYSMRNDPQGVRCALLRHRFEVTVLATQSVIDALAERIERAYRLRKPCWHGGCSTVRVWAVAATKLLQINEDNPSIPLDPELYVAAQPSDSPISDPWLELTQEDAVRAYRDRVRGIVRALRAELTAEVARAERRIEAGRPVSKVLLTRSRWISPLGRFIVARRAGRTALAERFLPEAILQHSCCPLYREASLRLLPPDHYPVASSVARTKAEASFNARRPRTQVPLNWSRPSRPRSSRRPTKKWLAATKGTLGQKKTA